MAPPGHAAACARALPCLPLGKEQQHLNCKKTHNTRPLLLLFSSSDEPRQLLPIKVSRSLEQALEKLSLSPHDKVPEGGCTGTYQSAGGPGLVWRARSRGCGRAGDRRGVCPRAKPCCPCRGGGSAGESWHHLQERSLQGGEYPASPYPASPHALCLPAVHPGRMGTEWSNSCLLLTPAVQHTFCLAPRLPCCAGIGARRGGAVGTQRCPAMAGCCQQGAGPAAVPKKSSPMLDPEGRVTTGSML